VAFDIMDIHNIHQGRSVSIFRSLPSWEAVLLLGSPEHHPRSLRGRWWFLRGIFVVFDIIYISINFQISTFLGSSLIPGFSRASSKESKRTQVVPERSLGGF
jgi:hypothetical protein